MVSSFQMLYLSFFYAFKYQPSVNKPLFGITGQYANISSSEWAFLIDCSELLGYLLNSICRELVQDINYVRLQNTQTQIFV